MATVALALLVRGVYQEVAHGDYARATGEAVATFPLAAASWGVIRAYARDGGDWVPLASPLFVGRGQRVAFDLAANCLRAASPDDATTERAASATTSVLGPPRRPGRGPTFANWRRGG